MKLKLLLILTVIAGTFCSCQKDESYYDGPVIAYFDKKGIIRDEISDNNRVVVYRVVSPIATKYDREYTITRDMGSTITESQYNLLDRKVVIKAGNYWADGRVEFNPEALSSNVDVLILGLKPSHGAIASFDNKLKLNVSERCDFVPSLYLGDYVFESTLFGRPSIMRKVEYLRNDDGSLNQHGVLIKDLYNVGYDVAMTMNYDDPKKVTPVVKPQRGGKVSTQTGVLEFWVHTTDQYSYPGLPKSANQSKLFTCSGEFNFYITFGVFMDNGDGTQKEGFLVGSPSYETLTKDVSPYTLSNTYVASENVEINAIVE
ncbi:MAG: hypothetical protein ACRDDZ_11455 [Marinifilaceae bacterium]